MEKKLLTTEIVAAEDDEILLIPGSSLQQSNTIGFKVKDEEEENEIEMDKKVSFDADWPEWKRNVKGLIYLDEYDGVIEDDVVKIEIPMCTAVDPTLRLDSVKPIYQCIKCGAKQPWAQEEIHRIKCNRCYNKAFNKVRPTKWVKFEAK